MDAVERAIQDLVWSQIDERVNSMQAKCSRVEEYRQRKDGEGIMYYI